MTGRNCKIRWSWRHISPSLTLSISYLSRLSIAAAVHSPSVNCPSNCLPHPHVFLKLFLLYHSSVDLLNCNYFATMAYLLPYLRTPFAHTVYRFFDCVIDCTFVYSMFVLLFVSHHFALSWPGRSCKWELVLNWPPWLNKGEIYIFLKLPERKETTQGFHHEAN